MRHTLRFRLPLLALVLLGAALLAPEAAFAQRRSGSVGLGGQIGDPSGVSVKLYNGRALSYDILGAWDTDDFIYLNVHGVREKRLGDARNVNYFYGPGAFVGVQERSGGKDDDVVLGVSGMFGLNVIVDRLEFFGQVTPRLAVAPSTDGDVGGGIGLRYYF